MSAHDEPGGSVRPSGAPSTHPGRAPQDGTLLWLRFTVLTGAGAGAAELLQEFYAHIAARALPAASVSTSAWVSASVSFVLGSLAGATLGTAQWIALHRNFEKISPLSWIGRSTLMMALAWLVLAPMRDLGPTALPRVELASLGAVGGVVVGLALGVSQMRALRGSMPWPLPWTSTCVLAWSLGASVTAALRGDPSLEAPTRNVALHLAEGLLGGGLAGGASGLVLVLFSRPRADAQA